jgi:hypothetical protein
MIIRLPNPARWRRSGPALLLCWSLACGGGWAAEAITNAPPPFAKGSLGSLDLIHKSLSLQTKDGEQTFGWTERTYFFWGKQKITADKLKVGDLVAVRHYRGAEGQLLILRLKLYRDGVGGLPEPEPLPQPPK